MYDDVSTPEKYIFESHIFQACYFNYTRNVSSYESIGVNFLMKAYIVFKVFPQRQSISNILKFYCAANQTTMHILWSFKNSPQLCFIFLNRCSNKEIYE